MHRLEHEVISIVGIWEFVEVPSHSIFGVKNDLVLVLPTVRRVQWHTESKCGD